ncbi:DUF7522 family protein [Salarchaeum japonicum]|uniref:Uncharacterized protein n=1 Tax=Salarchaeum japonicum TaxID=555573 RepID=A0AAV3SYW1_9EURY|nr:hypothetical protein [Salarchaeum japonicum]
MSDADTVVERLRREFGDALRSVTRYDADGYEDLYVREDVESGYADDRMERIAEETRMEALQSTYLRDLFQPVHGDFECTARFFEDGIELNYTVSETRGFAVGLDRHAGDADSVADRVERALDDPS